VTSARRGFTLIEVLVALVIVALGMGAVLTALSSAADSTARLREKVLAEWIGFNQISTVRLALAAPAAGSTAGAVEFAAANWHWQQLVEASEVPGVMRITVRVRHAPTEDTVASEDEAEASWLATTVGFRGDAINAASGELPDWNGTGFTPAAGGQQGVRGGGRGDPPQPAPPPSPQPPPGGGTP